MIDINKTPQKMIEKAVRQKGIASKSQCSKQERPPTFGSGKDRDDFGMFADLHTTGRRFVSTHDQGAIGLLQKFIDRIPPVNHTVVPSVAFPKPVLQLAPVTEKSTTSKKEA